MSQANGERLMAFGTPPPDCDAEQFGEHPSVVDGHCRCMTCPRCGHHTANTHHGHYGSWCSVTKSPSGSHFCCRDPEFGCELEHPAAGTPGERTRIPETPSQPAEAVGLRVRIHQHLKANPWLTVHELSRVLDANESTVRRRLRAMEGDGEAERRLSPKGPSDSRPVTTWSAT
jgi:hypothetical protein